MNRKILVVLVFVAVAVLSGQPAWSQATLSTGSIQGTITDPQGAVVSTAKVTVTSKGTGSVVIPPVSAAGIYSSGPLNPGDYVVRIEATGFKTVQIPVTVQVGNVATASTVLEIGAMGTVVTVEAGTVQVNLEQATIQGVVTQDQIENLPINGRNFLDLAQLQPGVQIQDGGNFDPTKKGFSSVSFGGRFGRTARIEVDGLDVSDETVGTTTQNIPLNSIQEFQASQSSLDISTELTSSGTLNVLTKSGTNQIHGEGGYYGYRDNAQSAVPSVFTQKQYGVALGGPIIKDKLFAFGAWERTTLDLAGSVFPPAPFNTLTGAVDSPFRDQEFSGRLDYNLTSNVRVFFKYMYEQNRDVASFVPGTYEPFANVDNTPNYAGGVDFTTGSFTHSFRIGYFKFRNGIVASPLPEGDLNPAPGTNLVVGNGRTSCTASGNLWCSGLNILAPQATYQSDKQFKYDGSKTIGTHTLRYGVGVNRILGGGFANFFQLGPSDRALFNGYDTTSKGCSSAAPCLSGNGLIAANGPFANGVANPLNWPLHQIELGNGEGCFTEIPQFGQPCGGQFDTRFQAYVADSWKVKSNLTFSYGLRYNRDTGRTDSDLPAVPALNAFQPGLGNPVRQPNLNFGGTLGLAWSPRGDSKTVIRAGAGLYYENAVFNNTLFDRPGRLPQGLFNQAITVCPGGSITLPDGSTVTSIDGLDLKTQVCGDTVPMGNVVKATEDLSNLYQQATKAAGPQANGAYFGNALTTVNTGSMWAPDYKTPRSYQMNIGFQREIHHGTVISVDYLRNVDLAIPIGIDKNHVGDARFLDTNAATNAINTTNGAFGCPTGIPGVTCAINSAAPSGCAVDPVTQAPLIGAHLCDYAANGLAGGINATSGGFPSTSPGTPNSIAFAGQNPNYGVILLLEPLGRAVYNALQFSLKSDLNNPLPFIKHMNAQVSYSLSRFSSQSQDLDFVNGALDYNNPGKFIGPGSLDRTNQLSGGLVMDLPWGFKADMITHWYTALPQNIFFSAPGNAEDIFQFDTTGDGQTGIAPVPGSNLGAFGRSVKAGDLNNFLQNYSTNFGNQLTPNGQALINANLMTANQLTALCAVTPSVTPIGNCATAYPSLQVPLAPNGQVGNDSLFTFDLTIGYAIRPIRSWENFRIEPKVTFFNLFNHPNYNDALSLLANTLDGGEGSINGTTAAQRRTDRVGLIGLGSGAFAFGAPRIIEFGIKVSF
jgi:hypothetical protein